MQKKILSLLSIVMSSYTAESADQWFKVSEDPHLFIQQVQEYLDSQIEFHHHRATVSREYTKKSYKDKMEALREMYGITDCFGEEDLIFKVSSQSHEEWGKSLIAFSQKIQELSRTERVLHTLVFIKMHSLDNKMLHEAARKTLSSIIIRNNKGRKWGANNFLIRHNIKTHNDFIADFSSLSSHAATIINKGQQFANLYESFDKVQVKFKYSGNSIHPIVRAFNAENVKYHFPYKEYVSNLTLIGAEKSAQGIINHVNETMAAISTFAEAPQNDKSEPEEELPKEPEKKVLSETISFTEETTEEKSLPENTENQLQPPPATTPVRKKGGSQRPAKKLTKRQLQKQKRQAILSQKQAVVVQQQVPVQVDIIPFADRFGTEELGTLVGILSHQRPISWKAFEKMVTSENGFKGAIYKNKGGSYRSIVFKDPMNDNMIQFMVHKPHKPGKEAAVLYHDFMKRVKHHLENKGVIKQ